MLLRPTMYFLRKYHAYRSVVEQVRLRFGLEINVTYDTQ